MCRTYIVYTCTSPLPSPLLSLSSQSAFVSMVRGAPGQKDPFPLVQKVWEERKNLCWLWMLNQSHQVCRRLRHHQCHQQHTFVRAFRCDLKKSPLFNHSNIETMSPTQVWWLCCVLPGHQSLPSTTSALSAFVNPEQFSSSLVWDQISAYEQQLSKIHV